MHREDVVNQIAFYWTIHAGTLPTIPAQNP